MIENSLTYQFEDGIKWGTEVTPVSIILKLKNGATITFIPEVVDFKPGPVFKPGQIVHVTNGRFAYKDRYGVVTSSNRLRGRVLVHMGDNPAAEFPPDCLEIIHEVE